MVLFKFCQKTNICMGAIRQNILALEFMPMDYWLKVLLSEILIILVSLYYCGSPATLAELLILSDSARALAKTIALAKTLALLSSCIFSSSCLYLAII